MPSPHDPSLPDELRAVEERLRSQRLDPGPLELDRLKQRALTQFRAGRGRSSVLRSRLTAAVTAVALLAGAGGAVALSSLDSHPNTNGGAADKQYKGHKGCHKKHPPKHKKCPKPKPKPKPKHHHKPKAHTGPSNHVTSNSGVIIGSVVPHGARTGYHFEWGTCASKKLNHRTRTFHTSPSSKKQASAKLGHLKPGTRYCYRIVASNKRGNSHGAIRSFRTDPAQKGKGRNHTSHRRSPSRLPNKNKGFTG